MVVCVVRIFKPCVYLLVTLLDITHAYIVVPTLYMYSSPAVSWRCLAGIPFLTEVFKTFISVTYTIMSASLNTEV